MKPTDYNSLYLDAQKRTKSPTEETASQPVNQAEPKPDVVSDPMESPVTELPEQTEEVLQKEPAHTEPPVVEPDVSKETESPVQSTSFSGIGNNSDDLDSFASEFDNQQENAVFVDPAPGNMPDTPQKAEPVHPTQDESDDEEDDEPVKQTKKDVFTRPTPYVPKKKSDGDDCARSRVRGVPTALIKRVQQQFSSGPNQDDAIAAYIYLKEGCPADMDVPDNIKEVAKSYCGEVVSNEDIQADFMEELNKIKNNDKQLMQKINAIEIAVAYAIFDRLGFRKGDITSESQINFTEAGMHELLDNLEVSSINYQTRLKKSEGRMKR